MTNYVWIKGKWRPVKSYRPIKRGRKKGCVEVELFYPEGRKAIILASMIKTVSDSTITQQKSPKKRIVRKKICQKGSNS